MSEEEFPISGEVERLAPSGRAIPEEERILREEIMQHFGYADLARVLGTGVISREGSKEVRVGRIDGGSLAVIESLASSPWARENWHLFANILDRRQKGESGLLHESVQLQSRFLFAIDASGFSAATNFMTPNEEATFDRHMIEKMSAIKEKYPTLAVSMKKMGDELVFDLVGSKREAMEIANYLSKIEFDLGLSPERLQQLQEQTPEKDYTGGTVKLKVGVVFAADQELTRSISVGPIESGLGSSMLCGRALDRVRDVQGEAALRGVQFDRQFEELRDDFECHGPRTLEPVGYAELCRLARDMSDEDRKLLAEIMMSTMVSKERMAWLMDPVLEAIRTGGDFVTALLSSERVDSLGMNACSFCFPGLSANEYALIQQRSSEIILNSGVEEVDFFAPDPPMFYFVSSGDLEPSAEVFYQIFTEVMSMFPEKANGFSGFIDEAPQSVMFERDGLGTIEVDASGHLIVGTAVPAKLFPGRFGLGSSAAIKLLPGLELSSTRTKKGTDVQGVSLPVGELGLANKLVDQHFPGRELVGVDPYLVDLRSALENGDKVVSINPVDCSSGSRERVQKGGLGTSAILRAVFRETPAAERMQLSNMGSDDLPYVRSLYEVLRSITGDAEPVAANPDQFMRQVERFLAIHSRINSPSPLRIFLDLNEMEAREAELFWQLIEKTGPHIQLVTTLSAPSGVDISTHTTEVHEMDKAQIVTTIVGRFTNIPGGSSAAFRSRVRILLDASWNELQFFPKGPRLADRIAAKLKYGEDYLLDVREASSPFDPNRLTFDPGSLDFEKGDLLVHINREIPKVEPYQVLIACLSQFAAPVSAEQLLALSQSYEVSLSIDSLDDFMQLLQAKGVVSITGSGKAKRYSLSGRFTAGRAQLRRFLLNDDPSMVLHENVSRVVAAEGFIELPEQLDWSTEVAYKAFLEHALEGTFNVCPRAAIPTSRLIAFYMHKMNGTLALELARKATRYLGEGPYQGEAIQLAKSLARCLIEFGEASDFEAAERILGGLDPEDETVILLQKYSLPIVRPDLCTTNETKRDAFLDAAKIIHDTYEELEAAGRTGMLVDVLRCAHTYALAMAMKKGGRGYQLPPGPAFIPGGHQRVDVDKLFTEAADSPEAINALRHLAQAFVEYPRIAEGSPQQLKHILDRFDENPHLLQMTDGAQRFKWCQVVALSMGRLLDPIIKPDTDNVLNFIQEIQQADFENHVTFEELNACLVHGPNSGDASGAEEVLSFERYLHYVKEMLFLGPMRRSPKARVDSIVELQNFVHLSGCLLLLAQAKGGEKLQVEDETKTLFEMAYKRWALLIEEAMEIAESAYGGRYLAALQAYRPQIEALQRAVEAAGLYEGTKEALEPSTEEIQPVLLEEKLEEAA